MSNELTVPVPGRDLIPDGWWKTTVIPWADEQTKEKDLQKGAAKLAALEAAMKTMGMDAMELMKGRRYIELDWGKLLGKGGGKGSGGPGRESQRSDSLNKDDRHRFRQLAENPKLVMKQLEVADREDQCTRTALLSVVKNAARPPKPDVVIDSPAQERITLHVADLTDEDAVIKLIGRECIDAIITDPPYGKKFNALIESLARVSKAVLKPNGSLFLMCGQSNLPDMFAILGGELIYRWTFAYLTPGGQSAQIWPVQINTFWKPVLWYSVDSAMPDRWNGDVIKSKENDNEKRFHEWGQSLSGCLELVEKASTQEHLVLDPFLGGGSIALAALALGRRVIGLDVDPQAVESTKARLDNATK